MNPALQQAQMVLSNKAHQESQATQQQAQISNDLGAELNKSMPHLKSIAQEIKSFQQGGGNPLDTLGRMFPNNPAVGMLNGGMNLENICRQKCMQDGLNFDEMLQVAKTAFNG